MEMRGARMENRKENRKGLWDYEEGRPPLLPGYKTPSLSFLWASGCQRSPGPPCAKKEGKACRVRFIECCSVYTG